jgi:hypothetical protein
MQFNALTVRLPVSKTGNLTRTEKSKIRYNLIMARNNRKAELVTTPKGLAPEFSQEFREMVLNVVCGVSHREPAAILRDLGYPDVPLKTHTRPSFEEQVEMPVEDLDAMYVQLILKDLNQAKNKIGQWLKIKEAQKQEKSK